MIREELQRHVGVIFRYLEFDKVEDLAAHIAERTGVQFADPRRPAADELERTQRVIESDGVFMKLMTERGQPFGQVAKHMRELVT
jgi:hypothetical protein